MWLMQGKLYSSLELTGLDATRNLSVKKTPYIDRCPATQKLKMQHSFSVMLCPRSVINDHFSKTERCEYSFSLMLCPRIVWNDQTSP